MYLPRTTLMVDPATQVAAPANYYNVGLGFDFTGLLDSAAGLVKTGVDVRNTIRSGGVKPATIIQAVTPTAAAPVARPVAAPIAAPRAVAIKKPTNWLMIGGIGAGVLLAGFLLLRRTKSNPGRSVRRSRRRSRRSRR
jgi:LPXTG-motif cell wall-anchored protein